MKNRDEDEVFFTDSKKEMTNEEDAYEKLKNNFEIQMHNFDFKHGVDKCITSFFTNHIDKGFQLSRREVQYFSFQFSFANVEKLCGRLNVSETTQRKKLLKR